jgi:hypothetical protein
MWRTSATKRSNCLLGQETRISIFHRYSQGLEVKSLSFFLTEGLSLSAINNGVAGQLSMGPHDASTDSRTPGITPAEKVAYAREEILQTARVASELEVPVVTGLIGFHVWDKCYIFPPANEKLHEEGVALFAERWNPVLDEFRKYGEPAATAAGGERGAGAPRPVPQQAARPLPGSRQQSKSQGRQPPTG